VAISSVPGSLKTHKDTTIPVPRKLLVVTVSAGRNHIPYAGVRVAFAIPCSQDGSFSQVMPRLWSIVGDPRAGKVAGFRVAGAKTLASFSPWRQRDAPPGRAVRRMLAGGETPSMR
jgi:hypothetical protein